MTPVLTPFTGLTAAPSVPSIVGRGIFVLPQTTRSPESPPFHHDDQGTRIFQHLITQFSVPHIQGLVCRLSRIASALTCHLSPGTFSRSAFSLALGLGVQYRPPRPTRYNPPVHAPRLDLIYLPTVLHPADRPPVAWSGAHFPDDHRIPSVCRPRQRQLTSVVGLVSHRHRLPLAGNTGHEKPCRSSP